jgi:hypothetical protein
MPSYKSGSRRMAVSKFFIAFSLLPVWMLQTPRKKKLLAVSGSSFVVLSYNNFASSCIPKLNAKRLPIPQRLSVPFGFISIAF